MWDKGNGLRFTQAVLFIPGREIFLNDCMMIM